MTEWQPIETAPKDGTWFIAEGEFRGGDTSSVMLCRYKPANSVFEPGVFYEWQVIDFSEWPMQKVGEFDYEAEPVIPFNWYSDRVLQWIPLG